MGVVGFECPLKDSRTSGTPFVTRLPGKILVEVDPVSFAIAMKNFASVLRAAGAGAENVVKVTVFVTDISDRSRINPIRQEYFGEHRPASSLFEVSNLVLPELKVEIEGEAVIFD